MKKVMFTLFALPIAVICIMTSNVSASNLGKILTDEILINQIQQTIGSDQISIMALILKMQNDTNPLLRAMDSIQLQQDYSKLSADQFALSQAQQQLAYDQTH
jgi:hypothetical protein